MQLRPMMLGRRWRSNSGWLYAKSESLLDELRDGAFSQMRGQIFHVRQHVAYRLGEVGVGRFENHQR